MATASHVQLIPALTGLRAFAAFWVLALHGVNSVAILLPAPLLLAIDPVVDAGFLGVDVFFVLSGFVISYNYARAFDQGVTAERLVRFLRTRLARIYPVHLVMLLALVVAVKGAGLGTQVAPERWSITALLQQLLLLHGWDGYWMSWNPVSWTISAEWLAYLWFPVVSALALAASRALATWQLWVLMLVVTVLPAARDDVLRLVFDAGKLMTLHVMAGFTAGCLAFRLYDQQRIPALPAGLALIALIAAGSVLVTTNISARWSVIAAPALVLGLAQPASTLTARVFSSRTAVYWGLVSYSLYMTHYLWLWVAKTVAPVSAFASADAATRAAVVALYLLPPLPIAAAMYHLVEEPSRWWLTGRRRAAVPAEASVTSNLTVGSM